MKLFLSFRYTGESTEALRECFLPVKEVLQRAGYEVYLPLEDLQVWEDTAMTLQEKFMATFAKLGASDAVVVVVRSNDRSEGMLMEVGYALGKAMPIHLFRAAGVETYIAAVANTDTTFQTHEELLEKINTTLHI